MLESVTQACCSTGKQFRQFRQWGFFPKSGCNEDSHRSGASKVPVSPVMEGDACRLSTLTVEDALIAIDFGVFHALLLAYAGMSWVAEAMEMMLLSFVGPAVHREWGLSSTQESIITSVVFLGMMIGAYTWGIVSDLKGRRFGFLVTAVLTFCAGILSAFAPNYYALLLLRGLVGIGLAGGPVILSWFLEFIPTPNRGLWMVIISVFWTVGTIAEALLAWAIMPTLGWRWLLGLSSVPLLFLLAFYPFVPESPRYLVSKGENDKALKVLKTIALINGKNLPRGRLVSHLGEKVYESEESQNLATQGECLLHEKDIILQQDRQGRSEINRVFGLFWSLLSPSMIRSTLLLWLVFFANAFTYYGLVLLTSQLTSEGGNCHGVMDAVLTSDTTARNSYADVLITSFAELPGLVAAALVVDRFGRKHSMAGLFLLCGVFTFPLVQQLSENMTVFLLFGARACISGAFTIIYIYAPEFYPTKMRTTGLGTASSFARIGGVVCPLVAVGLIRKCEQSLAASLFMAVPVLAAVAVLFFPVETSRRALTDAIQDSTL
eukprot:c28291_g1_i2 orf=36-1682(-)